MSRIANAYTEVGTCFAVPLPDGRYGHCRLLYRDQLAELVEFYREVTSDPLRPDEIDLSRLLFGPVQVSVTGAIRLMGWRAIGHIPVDSFDFPWFRQSQDVFFSGIAGVYRDWWLWGGGSKWTFVGELSEEQRKLEYGCVWRLGDLLDRIVTGHNPFDEFR